MCIRDRHCTVDRGCDRAVPGELQCLRTDRQDEVLVGDLRIFLHRIVRRVELRDMVLEYLILMALLNGLLIL